MNKVTLTINSRQYTVVAEESAEYIEALGNHINEKVSAVISKGTNVMGERPLVLAALNICDEYFKMNEAGCNVNDQLKEASKLLDEQLEEISVLKIQNAELKSKLDDIKNGQVTMDEAQQRASHESLRNQLSEAENKIVFLEGQITALEEKQKQMKQEFSAREREMLDLFNKQ